MQHGFVKVAAATPSVRVADCAYNAQKIVEQIKKAQKEKASLIVFPELSLTGCTCGDLFFQKALLENALIELKNILKETTFLDIVSIIGMPIVHNGSLYDCAVVIQQGKVLGVVPKKTLSNQSEISDMRYFHSEIASVEVGPFLSPFGNEIVFQCQEMPLFAFSVLLGDDIQSSLVNRPENTYITAVLSADSNFYPQFIDKKENVIAFSKAQQSGVIYANAGIGESTTDLVFAGRNIIAENGVLLAEADVFSEGILYSEIDVDLLENKRRNHVSLGTISSEELTVITFSCTVKDVELTRSIERNPFIPQALIQKDVFASMIDTQAYALKRRLEHVGAKKAIIGVSGGLDSTLAVLVAVKAVKLMGESSRDVLAITMPAFGTTSRTKNNAQILCDCLGVTFQDIPISESVLQHFEDIGHDSNEHTAVYENAQARERTQVLMDIANKENGVVVGTGDLSELALGWATYNGDHMSMYGVNGSIPKTLMRYLVRYCAEQSDDNALKEVLLDIVDTPVSPELLPADDAGNIAQETEDIVGPYELHDFFLYHMICSGFTPSKIYFLACHAYQGVFETATIKHWLQVFYRRFFSQQFKRSCMPDGPKVTAVSLSPRNGLHMPSDAFSKIWLDEINSL